MNSKYRTHTCGGLAVEHKGEKVTLSGWVSRVRDHGGLTFLDLRDNYGITQCVTDGSRQPLPDVTPESVIRIKGEVAKRPSGTENKDIPTGEIEVQIEELDMISKAAALPMQVFGDQDYPEDMLLRHRTLTLRKERYARVMKLRNDIIFFTRKFFIEKGFMEFQTPILSTPTSEGAKDFVVPSRIQKGAFYALPQAPQKFKQLLMVAGFDKYFQIAPCFRDEDSRADRTAEFYQIDFEMSFVERDDILSISERLIKGIWEEASKCFDIQAAGGLFPILTCKEAIEKYGTDRPDLRCKLEISQVTEAFRNGEFQVFAKAIEKNKVVLAIGIHAGREALNRSFCDSIDAWAKKEGSAGIGYVIFDGTSKVKGPLSRFIGEKELGEFKKDKGLKYVVERGGAIFFICDCVQPARKLAAQARLRLWEQLGRPSKNAFAFCWVVDFPMYEVNKEGELQFSHNPFSRPKGGIQELDLVLAKKKKPEEVLGDQYDLVCNGVEISSGSMRGDSLEMLSKAAQVVEKGVDLKKKYPALAEAFRYGVPPHGGFALGLDRILMLLTGAENIREVIPFPLDAQYKTPGEDLLRPESKDLGEYALALKLVAQNTR